MKVVLEGPNHRLHCGTDRKDALDTLARNPNRPIGVDAPRLEYVDDAGIALLFDLLRRAAAARGVEMRIRLAISRARRGLRPGGLRAGLPRPTSIGIAEHIGRGTAQEVADVNTIAFLGKCAVALRYALPPPRHLRWREAVSGGDRGRRQRPADRAADRLPDGRDPRVPDRRSR